MYIHVILVTNHFISTISYVSVIIHKFALLDTASIIQFRLNLSLVHLVHRTRVIINEIYMADTDCTLYHGICLWHNKASGYRQQMIRLSLCL